MKRGDPRLPTPDQISQVGLLDWAKRLVIRLYDLFRQIDTDLDQQLGFRFLTPTSITVNAGTTTDDVTTIQTMLDGTELHITEAAATPGYNVEVVFSGVKWIRYIFIRLHYDGIGTHGCRIQLYNYGTTAWDTFYTMLGDQIDYETLNIMVPDSAAYISSGAAIVRLYHTEAGNASHDLYVDYVALVN